MPTSEWPTDEQWERVITDYDPDEVETVARALHAAYADAKLAEQRRQTLPGAPLPRWLDTWDDELLDWERDAYRAGARAAIAALEQHRAGGEG
jgi:hypothetical protein